MSALIHAALFLTAIGLARAREQEKEGDCSACAGSGRVACSEHASVELAREENALLCTFYAGCERCTGTGSVDCKACSAVPSDDPGVAKLRSTAAARIAEYGKALGRPLLAAASTHFNLVLELEPMKVRGKKKSRHELLHLYLDRLEEVHRAYLELFALADKDITARSEVLLWGTPEDHAKAGQALCGYTTADVILKRGVEAISSIHFDPQKMRDDEALHRYVVHQAVHGIMNVQPPTTYTGLLKMGWADEGLSLWFEDRLLGAATGYCFWPEEQPGGLRGGNWRPELRKLLAPEETLDFERLLELDPIEMTRVEHAIGFALVDHLIARDPALFDRLLQRLRARTPSRDAIKEVYGQTLAELEASLREWVASTYPKR